MLSNKCFGRLFTGKYLPISFMIRTNEMILSWSRQSILILHHKKIRLEIIFFQLMVSSKILCFSYIEESIIVYNWLVCCYLWDVIICRKVLFCHYNFWLLREIICSCDLSIDYWNKINCIKYLFDLFVHKQSIFPLKCRIVFLYDKNNVIIKLFK